MLGNRIGVQTRESLLVAGPAVAVILAAFWFAMQFVEPAPPNGFSISTGSTTGAYAKFGQAYAEILAKSGIDLRVVNSAGSVENKKRLLDEKSGVQVALMQGGLGDKEASTKLMSLGRVFLEPLWLFYRADMKLERLTGLAGKRIGMGNEGSGTSFLASSLLRQNDVNSQVATFVAVGGGDGAKALIDGSIDAVFLTAAPESQVVQTLLREDGVKLMSFVRGEAYTRIFPYLSRVILPRGAIDLVRDLPPADVVLVAPQAALVAHADLHPALAGLLVRAAQEVHGGGGMFHRIGEFPKPLDPEYEMSEDAERMYASGAPFFQRFLPFWLATFIERMFVMIVPIATILIPLFKIVPAVYDWRIRRRILHWYAELKVLEKEMAADQANARHSEHLEEIREIEAAVAQIPVPLHYSDRFYELKGAVDLVRQKIVGR